MTTNRYSYNTIISLCARKASLEVAVHAYTTMLRCAAERPTDCSPDSYTFAGMVRCTNAARQWDLLPRLFK